MNLLGTIGRYGLAGIANTALGFALIMFCDSVLGLGPAAANAAGYAAGWVLGYILNRAFVFKGPSHRGTGWRYALAVGAAFLANQIVLHIAIQLGPVLPGGRIVSQAAGVATYTVVLFILCTLWVFRPPGVAPDSRPAV